jgi:membrane-associated phospholipid phosphatase
MSSVASAALRLDGPVRLPPSAVDRAAARAIVRHATPMGERTLKVVTALADEKLVLGAAGAFWLYGRLLARERRVTRCADHVLACAVISALLPHGVKRLVNRKRPDRVVPGARRHGIPRSGKPLDSFPSGHAVHLGALASAFSRFAGPRARPIIWPAALTLATTRILLLAHYPTDVLAGLGMGALIDGAVNRAFGLWRSVRPPRLA